MSQRRMLGGSSRALACLAMCPQPGTGRDGEPAALGGGAVGWLVAVDETEARLALVGGDVETDSSAVGQLRMPTSAHEFTEVGVGLTFDEQLGNAILEGFQLGGAGLATRVCDETCYVIADPLREGDGHACLRAHGLSAYGCRVPRELGCRPGYARRRRF